MTFDVSLPQTELYPPAPWNLRGKAIVGVQPIAIDQVRPLLPPELDVVQVFPGKTLGGIYIASYESGSILTYNELIVFCSLTRLGDRMGSWVTHIYVDEPKSVAGGREMWGLPKQMADFEWTTGSNPQVTVSQGDRWLCTMTYGWQAPGVRLPIPSFLTTFSQRGSRMVSFSPTGEATSHLLLGASVTVPDTSSFASLELNQPTLAFSLSDLRLSIDAPVYSGTRFD